MPRLPLSTDVGPSPGTLGLESPAEQAALGRTRIAELENLGASIRRVGVSFTEAGLELRRRQVQTDINNEILGAKEKLSLTETDLRRSVLEDPEVPNAEKSSIYLDRLGEVADELVGDLRYDASKLELRRATLGLARSGKLSLDRSSAVAAKNEQADHLDSLENLAARFALAGDEAGLDRTREDFDRALRLSSAFQSDAEVETRRTAFEARVQMVQLDRTVRDALDEGDLGTALRIAQGVKEFFVDAPAEQRANLIDFTRRSARTLFSAQEEQRAKARKQHAQTAVNELTRQSAEVEVALAAADSPEAAAEVTRAQDLLREEARFVFQVFGDELTNTQANQVRTVLQGTVQKEDTPYGIEQAQRILFELDGDVEERQDELNTLLAQGTISVGRFNSASAMNRQTEDRERAALISRKQAKLSAIFRPEGGGFDFSGGRFVFEGGGVERVKEAEALDQFQQYLAENPRATNTDMDLEIRNILRRLEAERPIESVAVPLDVADFLDARELKRDDLTEARLDEVAGIILTSDLDDDEKRRRIEAIDDYRAELRFSRRARAEVERGEP